MKEIYNFFGSEDYCKTSSSAIVEGASGECKSAGLNENNPLRILAVDDNVMNLKLISMQFKIQGYKVDTAENGLIACEMASQKDYDLICMDLTMPVMDGFEASSRILKRDRNKHPYIVAISGCDYGSIKMSLEEAGISEFIPKPLAMERLKQLIATVIERVQS